MNPGIVAGTAGIFWFVFIVVWLVSAISAKRTVRRSYSMWIFRIVIVCAVLFFVKYDHPTVTTQVWLWPSSNPLLDILGLALIALGIIIAFWARFHLARNWGMPMTQKENAELVTTGPYAHIRNPIYTGIILALAGSGWALGAWWFLLALASLLYFTYASKQEEKIMLEMFPTTYPAYKARTKMLIPWVL